MLFEVCAHPPPLVVGEGVAVLLKEGVDAGNAPVPTVLKVFQGQTSTSSHMTGVSDKSLVQLGGHTQNLFLGERLDAFNPPSYIDFSKRLDSFELCRSISLFRTDLAH